MHCNCRQCSNVDVCFVNPFYCGAIKSNLSHIDYNRDYTMYESIFGTTFIRVIGR